ncbi:MAG TPA: hypothetical protein VNQ90_06875 [Chthoniobacteraceae bacterium]|nr:hypothetical protein [Chthoniobacteraceae bacterium]
MIKAAFRLGRNLLLSTLFTLLASTGQGESAEKQPKLVVYVNPAMIPDSGICHLFADRISRVDFLFYDGGETPIRDLKGSTFTLDLPESYRLRSAAVTAGWGVFGGKHHEFRKEKVTRDGMSYLRYFIPLPRNPGLAGAEPVTGAGYGGRSNHQCRLFLEPEGAPPQTFTAYWKITGDPARAEGSFRVRLWSLPEDLPKPKRLFLLGMAAQVFPPWSDLEEIESTARMLKATGISYVPSVNRSKLLERDLPDVWTREGFRLTALLYEPTPRHPEERDSLPGERDYLVGLDGKRARGYPAEKYHMRLYCPLSLNTPGRTGFEIMKEKALKAASEGAEVIDWDLEPQTWTQCFCDDCRKAFASQFRLAEEEVMPLRPIDLIATHPEKWYRFRSGQSAKFYRNLRKAVRERYPNARISANSLLVAVDQDFGDIGRGICTFAEDPRLLDDEVDFHTIDTLTGSAADPVFLDAVRRGTKKPLIGTAGCSYSVAYNHNYIAGRRMRADLEGLPLGYDRRGDLQRLGMLSSAASGAVGIRVPILLYQEPTDAQVAVTTAEAAADLSKVERFYLDGKRHDQAVEIVDLTEKPSPWLEDRSIVAGGPWKKYYDRFGGKVQFRVHRLGDEMLVSLFNWDPWQTKRWLVRPGKGVAVPEEGWTISDHLGGAIYALEENAKCSTPLRWSAEQLKEGIGVEVPSAGYVILRLDRGDAPSGSPVRLIAAQVRAADLERAANLKPFVADGWRTGEPVDLLKEALYRIERTSRYFSPEVVRPK